MAVTRVAVFGAAGRMGTTVCAAVSADPGMDLVAGVDPSAAGRDLGEMAGTASLGIALRAAASDLEDVDIDVAVHFSSGPGTVENLRWCATRKIHSVVGTTGIPQSEIDALAAAFLETNTSCLVVPNFAVGAVLMMRFAELAARHMQSAEIVELHHDGKADAPSGTSIATARRMSTARSQAGMPPFPGDRTTTALLPGARGGAGDGGIRIHSVRLPGLVAHQEVILGSAGETLTIRHDSADRISFMPGVLLAIRHVAEEPGLTVGLERLLGI